MAGAAGSCAGAARGGRVEVAAAPPVLTHYGKAWERSGAAEGCEPVLARVDEKLFPRVKRGGKARERTLHACEWLRLSESSCARSEDQGNRSLSAACPPESRARGNGQPRCQPPGARRKRALKEEQYTYILLTTAKWSSLSRERVPGWQCSG